MSAYEVRPIGWVRMSDGRTTIALDERYRPGLRGVDALESIWVPYGFDRNDTPERRAILPAQPHGDPDTPLRGIFATRAPVRAKPIALSRCGARLVQGSVIEIGAIDAFADTPLLDIEPAGPSIRRGPASVGTWRSGWGRERSLPEATDRIEIPRRCLAISSTGHAVWYARKCHVLSAQGSPTKH